MREGRDKRATIGVMLGDRESDYSVDLIKGFYSCAKEEDVNIIFLAGPQIPQYCSDILAYNLEGNYNYQFDTIYDYVHFMNLDALIIATGSISYYYHNYEKDSFLKNHAKVPHILIQDTDEKVPYLVPDNYAGMRACVEHLTKDHGYKKIVFLSGPKVNPEANERLEAYKDVMRECGLPVEDKMIAYGNFTELVEDLVEQLMDNNPGVEAIVCANDNMAEACYKVCKRRNLTVGKDIAITGYDDVDLAKQIDPPMTSVTQKSFQFSYTALQKAIALCKGKSVASSKEKTRLVVRNSCGCCGNKTSFFSQIEPEEIEQSITEAISKIDAMVFETLPFKKERKRYKDLTEEYFQYIYKTVFLSKKETVDMEYIENILAKFVKYPYISHRGLAMYLVEFLQTLSATTRSSSKKEQLIYVARTTQEYIFDSISRKKEKEMIDLNRKAWFVPSFTRDLNRKGSREDLREVMRPIMERFQVMGVKSCYFYLFEEPVIYDENISFNIPEKIYLTAYYNSNEMECFSHKDRPCVTVENGFTSFLYPQEQEILTSFILFSGEKQYGILLCDVDLEDISFLQICGMQLGSLLRFLDLNWTEQDSYQELQKSLKVIQEKNHILSFISEYDELSNLLNRRGFMERVITSIKKYDGRKAYLIFGDLDHLKEINDCFGHTAGDFAIKSAADRLKKVLPIDAITARIGGDEFVSLILSEMPGFKDAILSKLENAANAFNQNMELPYYVDLSVGIHEFICEPSIDVNEMLEKSDELLYEAKKKRRKTIRK